jgi:hypothetical protein
MKRTLLFLILIGVGYHSKSNNPPTKEQNDLLKVEKNHVRFIENKGQVKDQHWQPRPDVLFSGETQGMVFHIRNNGISYQLLKEENTTSSSKKDELRNIHEIEDKTYSIYRVDVNWLNANKNFDIQKGLALQGYSNYYNVPNGVEPALYVKSYENVLLKNVWKGVDLHFFEKDGILESDWLMQNAENYKNIKFEVKGAMLSTDKEGYLIMKTPFGEIREGKLKVYQEGKELVANWVIQENEVSFNIENYNADLPLRIDPPTLIWGTYYGGSLEDKTQALVTDNNENIYMSGATKSTADIATIGSHQTTFGGLTNFDAFLVKFNSNGVRQWSTYYGGNGSEEGKGLAIDLSGNLYLAGHTTSSSGISTSGSQQLNLNGTWDAFVTKLNNNGVRQWGTYCGGPGEDWGESVTVDASGNVYLGGATSSTSVIASAGTHQTSYGGGTYDGFIVKYNTNGAKQWGTYYGGSAVDWIRSIVSDNAGNVYFAGYTASTTNISTLGSFPGGIRCAFYVKLNSSGVRQFGRYYGGISGSDGFALAIDASNNLYLSGLTSSTDNSMGTIGTHQPTHGGGTTDAFLAKFDAASTNGTRLWGTFYGGGDADEAYAVTSDINGNVYIAGRTRSLSDIATVGAFQTTHGGGVFDAYVVQFNSSGIRLSASYYGGTDVDYGNALIVGSSGDIYLGGETSSTASIASVGAHQTIYGGGTRDAFLTKLQGLGCSGAPAQPTAITGNTTLCAGASETYSVSNDVNATSYTWTLPGSWSGTSTTNSISATAGANGGAITVTANNACGSSAFQTLAITVNNLPAQPTAITGNTTLCAVASETYSVSNDVNATSYTWTLPSGWSGSSNTNSISATAGVTGGTITVTANNACGSSTSQTLAITVNNLPAQPTAITGNTTLCAGASETYSVSNDVNATSYTWTLPSGWSGSSNTNSISATAGVTGGTITVTANNACGSTTSQTLAITVNNLPAQPTAITGNTTLCAGASETYSVSNDANATSYTWTLPSGWSGSSNTNSISATAGAIGGTITVTANNACGSSTSQTLAITVNNVPAQPSAITGSPTLCAGASETYSVSNDANATSYTWTLPGGWSGTSTTNSISATAGANGGTITVTANNACGSSNFQILSITVNTLPVVIYTQSPDFTCINYDVFTLGAVSPTGGSFSGSGVEGNNFNPGTAGLGTHIITYSFTDGNGCTAQQTQQIEVDECLGFHKIENKSIAVYPNPFHEEFTVNFTEIGKHTIHLVNSLGQIIINLETDQQNIVLQTGNLSSGVYYLMIVEDNVSIKLIKK